MRNGIATDRLLQRTQDVRAAACRVMACAPGARIRGIPRCLVDIERHALHRRLELGRPGGPHAGAICAYHSGFP